MNPTDADYEKLARTLCLARGTDPDEWEMEGIDEGEDVVSSTRETLEAFRQNSKNWRERSTLQEVNGGLYWAECQPVKGQRRCELCVVDRGDFRLIFQC